jgi:hypothetical protein
LWAAPGGVFIWQARRLPTSFPAEDCMVNSYLYAV